jgi:hypothetical protein
MMSRFDSVPPQVQEDIDTLAEFVPVTGDAPCEQHPNNIDSRAFRRGSTGSRSTARASTHRRTTLAVAGVSDRRDRLRLVVSRSREADRRPDATGSESAASACIRERVSDITAA